MSTAIPDTFVQGNGSCTYQPVTPVTRIIQVSSIVYREVVFYPYVFTATPAAGWAFDHFEIYIEQIWSSGSIVHDTNRKTTNPFSLPDDIPSGWASYPPYSWPATLWLGEWTNYNTSSHTSSHSYYSKYEITAVFKRLPTHLLVNSSTVESPAKLVYDPTTNLLVADY